jgi:hypothetical protein
MPIMTEQDRSVGADLGYQVVATMESSMLPQMRAVLATLHPLSVVVSSAVSWSGGGDEIRYRGQSCRLDRQIARMEITCAEVKVDWIVNAIDRVLTGGRSRERGLGTVVAFPIARAGVATSARSMRAAS